VQHSRASFYSDSDWHEKKIDLLEMDTLLGETYGSPGANKWIRAMIKTSASESNGHRVAFGYAVMGPIFADMLRQFYACLHASPCPQDSVVFFCARGGLVLRRMLELFARSVGLDLQVQCKDFMVSRLAAFRPAFQVDATAVTDLIEMEFAGRTCGQAVHALANIEPDEDPKWNEPFSVVRLIKLMESTEPGRRARAVNQAQAELLRRYIDTLCGTNMRVMLCDSGVFGSILRYLQVGVPAVDWRLTLLFRANYKHISAPHFESTVGVVSECNTYLPWRPATVALLYWQLIETMLEPPVPSVRYYETDSAGRVMSDLELPDWENMLEPPAESMLAGTCSYLRELTPKSIPLICSRGQIAWAQLRHRIVFPTTQDVALLAVGRRNLGFGIDETAEFTSRVDKAGRSMREKLLVARASMWPEGEMRKQFPRTASLFLAGSELLRLIRARTATARGS
jgi:hypothetical protein